MNICFYYESRYPFSDGSYTGGVGGSEAAFLLLIRALRRLGHTVTVFARPLPADEDYRHTDDFDPHVPYDAVVVMRFNPELLAYVRATVKLFWSTHEVEHQLSAEVMLSPCVFPEMFCIAALECMAAGAVPVTTHSGALPTTIGEHGVLIDRTTEDWPERLTGAAVACLLDGERRGRLARAGRWRALAELDWSAVAARKWVPILSGEGGA